MSDNELIQKAIKMRSKALAPYSSYKVGAAVLTAVSYTHLRAHET